VGLLVPSFGWFSFCGESCSDNRWLMGVDKLVYSLTMGNLGRAVLVLWGIRTKGVVDLCSSSKNQRAVMRNRGKIELIVY